LLPNILRIEHRKQNQKIAVKATQLKMLFFYDFTALSRQRVTSGESNPLWFNMSCLIVHMTEHRAVYNILLARTILQHSTSSGNFPEHRRNNTGFLINFENEVWFPFVTL
jgi:uncharacterized membrane protein YhdT